MTDLSISANLTVYKPKHKMRFVTAASLFDGHDASINIMRRILQGTGCEVIHLGHNRSVNPPPEAPKLCTNRIRPKRALVSATVWLIISLL